jgi:hypothetical protein
MRFTGPDSLSPFGAGGINAYAYCSGDPANHADPSGHFTLDLIAQDWGAAWRAIGRDLHAADPVPWINKLASKGTTPAARWFMGQKWARYTPLYWALYGLGVASHAAQPVTNTFGWMGDLAMVVPGVDEADEADEVLQGVGDVAYDAYDASTDTSYSTEPVTTSGRIEGDAEPVANYREAPTGRAGELHPLEQQWVHEQAQEALNVYRQELWEAVRDTPERAAYAGDEIRMQLRAQGPFRLQFLVDEREARMLALEYRILLDQRGQSGRPLLG